MRNFLPILAAIGIILLFYAVANPPKIDRYYYDKIEVGQINLENKTTQEGTQIIQQAYEQPVYININNRSFGTNLSELGFLLNMEYLTRYTKECAVFIAKVCKPEELKDFKSEKVFTLDKTISAQYTKKLNEQLKAQKQDPNVDLIENTYWLLSDNADVAAEENFIQKIRLSSEFGKRISLYIEPVEVDNVTVQKNLVYEHTEKISTPLLVKYGRKPLYIDKRTIKGFIDYDQHNTITHANISKQKVSQYLDELAKENEFENVKIVRPEAEDAIIRAILFRAADTNENTAVILPLEGLPISSGDKAEKYLEVVKSQQRLYKWENGEVAKTYVISTGILAETPTGEFKILAKQKKTISYFGNWWMENYLPIGYMSNGNRFGFHAIPYHQDANGAIWSRDPNTMGSPATSGCIQLTQDESLELYEWAKVGMPVFVYE